MISSKRFELLKLKWDQEQEMEQDRCMIISHVPSSLGFRQVRPPLVKPGGYVPLSAPPSATPRSAGASSSSQRSRSAVDQNVGLKSSPAASPIPSWITWQRTENTLLNCRVLTCMGTRKNHYCFVSDSLSLSPLFLWTEVRKAMSVIGVQSRETSRGGWSDHSV